ncbi:MAG: 3-deoxy-D-manno-octulosonic acid transferase, partial [Cyclobacteriaceae bacterium]|nr:3-deoxy-D-manno-octulosonic acid transferase [Cyclobacteriaceae bacterium]
ARQFIRLINPSLVIFVKYEFWYHYITFLRDNNIPILSISSIFRPDHIFFKFYGGFFREMLKKVDHFFVQNEESVSLLHKLGIKGVTNSGDTRFDRVYQLREQEIKLPLIEKFKGEDKLLILGSIWTTDMDRIAGFVNTVAEKESIKIILAPHEIQEANIRRQLKDIRLSFIKYSEANEENVSKARLLIIDNIGMLSTLYRYGDYAYIGGSFGVGLHNILEAATFGLPLFFGSQNFKRFREANELIKLGGAFPISSSEELMKVFQHVSQEEEKIRVLNSQYVQENTGATEKIVNYCLTLLENGRDRH